MASAGMSVATIGSLWMVLTLAARSSVSNSSLNSSKGLIFYIQLIFDNIPQQFKKLILVPFKSISYLS